MNENTSFFLVFYDCNTNPPVSDFYFLLLGDSESFVINLAENYVEQSFTLNSGWLIDEENFSRTCAKFPVEVNQRSTAHPFGMGNP